MLMEMLNQDSTKTEENMEKESLLHNISQGSNLPSSRFFLWNWNFRAWKKPGQVIQTSTQITAHHKGFVEFKLCPRNDETMTGDELQVFDILETAAPNSSNSPKKLFLVLKPSAWRTLFWMKKRKHSLSFILYFQKCHSYCCKGLQPEKWKIVLIPLEADFFDGESISLYIRYLKRYQVIFDFRHVWMQMF